MFVANIASFVSLHPKVEQEVSTHLIKLIGQLGKPADQSVQACVSPLFDRSASRTPLCVFSLLFLLRAMLVNLSKQSATTPSQFFSNNPITVPTRNKAKGSRAGLPKTRTGCKFECQCSSIMRVIPHVMQGETDSLISFPGITCK